MSRKYKILTLILKNSLYIAVSTKIHQHDVPLGTKTLSSAGKPQTTETCTPFSKFKKLMKNYWHVALPVHAINSIIWFGCCYYVTDKYSYSEFNIMKHLKRLSVRQDVIDFLSHSEMGQWTVTVALYKLLTPFRIATTLVGTTASIYYLSKLGLIKPTKCLCKKHNNFRRKNQ